MRWPRPGSCCGTRTAPATSVIIHDLRIPRTLLGVGVGAALGLAGALMQALTRNPLAEPGLLGVNLGASTGVVIAIAFLGVTPPTGYVWFAFAGAAVDVGRGVRARRRRPGADARTPGAGRRRAHPVLGAFVWAVLVTRARGVRPLPALGRRLARRPRDGDDRCRWRRSCVAGILLALALGRPAERAGLGDESATALGAHPGRIRVLGIARGHAAVRRRDRRAPGRSGSSAWPCRTRPA